MKLTTVLSEMAIPVGENESVWGKINDLLKDDKYKEAAAYFIAKGGTNRGVTRSWNAMQKRGNELSTGTVLDSKHSLKKFKESIPEEYRKPEKNKTYGKKTPASKKKEAETGIDVNYGNRGGEAYDTVKNVKRRQIRNLERERVFKTNQDKVHDKVLKKKYDPKKDTDKLKKLKGEHAEFSKMAEVNISAQNLEKREIAYNKAIKDGKTKAEAREETGWTTKQALKLVKLRRANPSVSTNREISKRISTDLGNSKTDFDLNKMLDRLIKQGVTVNNGELKKEFIVKVRDLSSGEDSIRLATKLKRVFRTHNAKNSSIEKLSGLNFRIGKAHTKAVDKVLDPYITGEGSVTFGGARKLLKEIDRMMPVMTENRSNDPKGWGVYTRAKRMISAFLNSSQNKDRKDNEEIDIDEAERLQLFDDLAEYHDAYKREAIHAEQRANNIPKDKRVKLSSKYSTSHRRKHKTVEKTWKR